MLVLEARLSTPAGGGRRSPMSALTGKFLNFAGRMGVSPHGGALIGGGKPSCDCSTIKIVKMT